jgi:hypothetical protein
MSYHIPTTNSRTITHYTPCDTVTCPKTSLEAPATVVDKLVTTCKGMWWELQTANEGSVSREQYRLTDMHDRKLIASTHTNIGAPLQRLCDPHGSVKGPLLVTFVLTSTARFYNIYHWWFHKNGTAVLRFVIPWNFPSLSLSNLFR